MQALRVVLHDELPVRLDLVRDAVAIRRSPIPHRATAVGDVALHVPARTRRAAARARAAMFTKTNPFHVSSGDPPQRPRRAVESLARRDVRRAEQGTVGGERPRVVRTLDHARSQLALAVEQSRAAMAARVEERRSVPSFARVSSTLSSRDLAHQVGAGRRQLLLATDADPLGGEDPLLLVRPDGGVVIRAPRQRRPAAPTPPRVRARRLRAQSAPSLRISRTTWCPGRPVTPPPACVADEHW